MLSQTYLLWFKGNGFCKCAVLTRLPAQKLKTLCLYLPLRYKSYQVQDDCLFLFEMMDLYFIRATLHLYSSFAGSTSPNAVSAGLHKVTFAFKMQLCAANQSLVFRISRCLYYHYVMLVGAWWKEVYIYMPVCVHC